MNLNILPLGSYDFLIGMDMLEQYRAIFNFVHKTYIFTSENGETQIIRETPRPISTHQIFDVQLKRDTRKKCELFSIQVEYHS